MYATAMLAFASVNQPIRSPRGRQGAGGEAGIPARTTGAGRIGRETAGHDAIRLPFVSRMRITPR